MKNSLLFSVYGHLFKGYLLITNMFVSMMVYFLWFMVRPSTSEGILVSLILTLINLYGWLSIIFLNDYNPEFDDLGDRK